MSDRDDPGGLDNPGGLENQWSDFHRRMDRFEQRLGEGFGVSGSELDRRLLERTRLAAAAEQGEAAGGRLEVFSFTLGGERYAIGSEHVSEVVPFNQFTPLPGTPPWIMGIVPVRGRVVSVVDLRQLFELPVTGLADRNFLAVLRGPEMEFGLFIDRVLGIETLPLAAVQPEVANLTGVRAAWLLGVTADHCTILDGARLLGDPAMRIIIE